MIRLQFIVFLSVFTSIYLGMHYYVYARIVHGLGLSAHAALYIRLFFLFAALTFALGEMLVRKSGSYGVTLIACFGAVWLGIIAIAISVFAASDILRLFIRSADFRWHATVGSLILIGLLSGYSLYNGLRKPVVREFTLAFKKLPDTLKGFTIVQLSDIHIHLSSSSRWLKSIVERTNALDPDLIVITGDLIDADLCKADHICEALSALKAKHGVYAVTGNHEFYSGIALFEKIAANSNIRLLRNRRETIAEDLELIGIDDAREAKRFSGQSLSVDMERAFNGIDRSKLAVLLSHQPDVFDMAQRMGADLQLSGHTHNGQIPPLDIIVQFVFKYPYGLYEKGGSYLYTTSGTGWWGPPMRLSSKPEIVKIILQ